MRELRVWTGQTGGIEPPSAAAVRSPRLARHTIVLRDGHRVGIAVAGVPGVPIVLVHGFSAEGFLYAQTLSRLVRMGFAVIAVDVAGHGTTIGLPTGGDNLDSYVHLLQRTLDELGIRRAVIAGHSMGGRLAAQLAAVDPDRVLGVLLLDAIVGDQWDGMVNLFRVVPPLLALLAGVLLIDTVSTAAVLKNPRQSLKLGRLVAPTLFGHLQRPWRLVGPAVSVLRSGGSRWMLEKLRQEQIPVVAIHGDRDLVVPLATAKAAARQARGELVTVRGATHSWLLKDPETLPAIMADLRAGPLGEAVRRVNPARCYARRAWIKHLAPSDEIEQASSDPGPRRDPHYRWTIERPR